MSNVDTANLEYGVFAGEDVLRYEKKKEPIIQEMFYNGDVMFLTSEAGCGKSILALQIACALTTGTALFETFEVPKPRNVLYVQTEGSRAETIHRLKRMLLCLKLDFAKFVHFNVAGLYLNTQEGFTWFMKYIERVPIQYDVVIIDPLYTTVKGSLSNDDVATDYWRNIRGIRERYHSSFIIIHHEGKPMYVDGVAHKKHKHDLMGSTFWAAYADANYKLDRIGNKEFALVSGKGDGRGRGGNLIESVHLKMFEPSPLLFKITDHNLPETQQKIVDVMKAEPGKQYRRVDLEEIITKSKPTICRALASLLEKGKIQRTQNEDVVLYTLPKHES